VTLLSGKFGYAIPISRLKSYWKVIRLPVARRFAVIRATGLDAAFVDRLGPARVGVVDEGTAAQVVVPDTGAVVPVVAYRDEFLQRVVGVAGPDRLLAATLGRVELLEAHEHFAGIPIGDLLVAVGVGHDLAELRRA